MAIGRSVLAALATAALSTAAPTVGAADAQEAELPGETGWVDGPAGELRIVDTGPVPPGPDDRTAEAPGSAPAVAPPVGGSRAVVLFVHSLAGSLEQWTAQLRHLEGRRRAVALDLRGHGESAIPDRVAYTVVDLAEDVVAVVEALALERVVLVGHSLGGGVIAAFAARHPGKVAGLLFVDPVGDQRLASDELVQFLFELDRDYEPTIRGYWDGILKGATKATRSRVMADLDRTSPEAVVRALEGLLTFEPVPLLADYDGPMRTVVTPMNDLPLSLHRVVPDLEAVTVEGTSHWLHMDRPATFHQHLDAFLRQVDRAPHSRP